jgi:tRNA dimethylallyltransferase
VALAIAEAFDAVIVSADAMQVYRQMDIGTGKATTAEREQAPHFGIDIRDANEPFDAADFVVLADEVRATHPRVVIVGGTTLYLRAFTRGLVDTPEVDPALRQELQALPNLHAELQQVDPALADRLHANDHVRILRGLEVFRITGKRLSDLHAEHASQPDRVICPGLWLDREDLDSRIDARVHQMIEDGYVAEVRGLLASGYPRHLKPMQSLGYRHLCDHVLDGLDLDEAVRRTQRDTRRFARKQRTWKKQLGYAEAWTDAVDAGLDLARQTWGLP